MGVGVLGEHEEAKTGLADTELTEEELAKLTDVERADLEFADITEAERAELEDAEVEHMVIKRQSDRLALIRQEDGCRTEYDFEKLVDTYDRLDNNRERRERYNEIGRPQTTLHLGYTNGRIIPTPISTRFWREILNGNFLDIIFDCPHEIQELTASKPVYELVGALKDGQKEVFYYWEIRGWTPQRIAVFRGQTDRNILKIHATMIKSLQYKLYKRLMPRFMSVAPLTRSQCRFMVKMEMEYGERNALRMGEQKPKRKRRTKAEIQADKEKQGNIAKHENTENPTQEGGESPNE
jgi:hypothetical protein